MYENQLCNKGFQWKPSNSDVLSVGVADLEITGLPGT